VGEDSKNAALGHVVKDYPASLQLGDRPRVGADATLDVGLGESSATSPTPPLGAGETGSDRGTANAAHVDSPVQSPIDHQRDGVSL
jgi:hypothetical protein